MRQPYLPVEPRLPILNRRPWNGLGVLFSRLDPEEMLMKSARGPIAPAPGPARANQFGPFMPPARKQRVP